MNYEDLYQTLSLKEKTSKEHLAAIQKISKSAGKKMESGDLKGLTKDLDSLRDLADSLALDLADAAEAVDGFDTAAYFENGDFARQLLDACQAENVDVQGDFPVYEMFPYRVKLDVENQDVYLDRKKYSCARPKSFVQTVKKGQERLKKASFNEQTFLNELSDAYFLALLQKGKQAGYDVYLKDLYKYLAPMSRYRKEYDMQNYAFDLARLYGSGVEKTKDGRRYQFGPSRFSNKSIRILDRNGQEQHLSTICFYDRETDQ